MSKQKLPTIAPLKPPAKLPAASSGQLPATLRGPNPIKVLHKFVEAAEELEEHYRQLEASISKIEAVTRVPHSVDAQKHLDRAHELLARHDSRFRALAQRLQAETAVFDPAEAYDDDGGILEARVWLHLGTLLSGYPNANVGNEESYIGNMVGEVLTVCDSEMALKLARGDLLKTSKFPPACAEVVKAIEEQQKLWDSKSAAIDFCEDTAEELRDALKRATEMVATAQVEREKERRAAEEKKRADDEVRAQPLKVGDRVQNTRAYHMGPGTIAEASRDGFYVFYDSMANGYVDAKDLQRFILGEPGFQIAYGKRAAVEKRLAEYRELLQRRPVVGDRVTDDIAERHPLDDPPNGAGTVVFAAVVPGAYDDGFTIQFDNGVLGVAYAARQLNRLLPDDPEFERSEKVAAGWRAWELKHDVETGEKLAASTDDAS
jgi:hypothetical protein